MKFDKMQRGRTTVRKINFLRLAAFSYQFPADARKETAMPWLVILTLTLGVAAAGTASAAVYVPGHLRDGVYTRPHFLDSPAVRYDRKIKLDGGLSSPPKPTIDHQLPPKKLTPERAS
jgi:hypothetical protein